MEDKAKKTVKKYRVNRASVGINLMGACDPIILHNGLTQKKLKELYELGFANVISIIIE